VTAALRRLGVLLVLALAPPAWAQPAVMVYAASDLAFAMREIAPLFERASGARVTLVLGSTGNLARQIEHGAPADLFFAADEGFIDGLRDRGIVIAETRTLYAQGRLVLASVRRARAPLEMQDLVGPGVKRLAIANPDHAPYGRAAREALERLGLWERVRPKLVYAENIRHALQFLQAGAVDAALVARAIAEVPEVVSVPVDPALHRPLNQVAAVVRRSPRPELALAFLHFVIGPEGRPIMKRRGYLLPGEF
jgi:molybdate transport system substrate-binding protein